MNRSRVGKATLHRSSPIARQPPRDGSRGRSLRSAPLVSSPLDPSRANRAGRPATGMPPAGPSVPRIIPPGAARLEADASLTQQGTTMFVRRPGPLHQVVGDDDIPIFSLAPVDATCFDPIGCVTTIDAGMAEGLVALR